MRNLRGLTGLLDLIVPPGCGACALPGEAICASCRAAIAVPGTIGCRRCAHPWAVTTDRCSECPPALDTLACAAAYVEPVPALMSALKDRGRRQLAAFFAELIAERCGPPAEGVCLVPVALGREREKTRGFNQAALIAARLGTLWDRPVMTLVARTRDDPPQRGASATDRATNVRGAFAARPGAPVVPEAWLVDDVCTTGATLAACARALRRHGVRRVGAVCAARVLRGP